MRDLYKEKEQGGLVIQSYKSFPEVVDRLRLATLKDDPIPNFHPYLRSKITLEEVSIEQLRPCALYVLKSNLERVRRLRGELEQRGIDPFAMKPSKTLVVYSWEGRENCLITPPLIEVSEDDGGLMIVVDGLHRVTQAKREGRRSMVITKIQNVAIPLPVLPVEWGEVKVVDEVPSSEQKRRYRYRSMREIQGWIDSNQERFIQGFDLESLIEKTPLEEVMKNTPGSQNTPWDFLIP